MSRPIALSIVVSTFQRRAVLKRALDSLLDQRLPEGLRYEIVVVDNNCTDGTRDLVADSIRQHPDRVRYAFEPRPGVSNGRNAGIRAARGEYVAFTDDDNVVTRNWVATIVDHLRSRTDVVGVGGKVLPEWPDETPRWLDRRHWSPLAILDYGDRPFCTSARRPMCLLTANLAMRRDVLMRLGGFDPRFQRCQDHELLLRVWRGGGQVLYAPDMVTTAPVEPERLTRRYHRRWHERHGRFAAQMRLEEAIDRRGRLRRQAPHVPRLAGSPGYVYVEAARHAAQWMASAMRRERARAAHHEHRLRYFLSYIRQGVRAMRKGREPVVLETVAFLQAHLGRRARRVNMSAGRIVGAHAAIVILLGASAWDIVTGEEHWPASPYPMFSSVEQNATLDSLVLRGVTAGPDRREIPMRASEFIAPFDQCRITTAMQRAATAGDGGARLHAMLTDTLARYEEARDAGRHDGPPLAAIRVYDAHWTLQATAANADEPDGLRLIDSASATGH